MNLKLNDRIYNNTGNEAVLRLVDDAAVTVLDVGCGAGSNAAILRKRDPHKRIFGITSSAAEAALASQWMEQCWIMDLEGPLPPDLCARRFDVVIFSHVLEHLRMPAAVLAALMPLVNPNGTCIIAVPNIMCWRERIMFLVGRFEYRESGIMDDTHLRFFSYDTADRYLLSQTPNLRMIKKTVTGSAPLWILRRRVLTRRMSRKIDEIACRLLPNLFGDQVVMKLVTAPEPYSFRGETRDVGGCL